MRWQRWAVVWALGALWAGGSAAEVGPVKLFPSPTVRGEWTQDRGDLAQSGRCLLPGRIKQPAVAWSLPVGARRTRVAVRPAAGETTLALQSTT